MKLSDLNIQKAKPSDKTRKLSDGGGLFIVITVFDEPAKAETVEHEQRYEWLKKIDRRSYFII
jgi:hypothetical protein